MVITLLHHFLLGILEWLQFLMFHIFKKMFSPRFFGDITIIGEITIIIIQFNCGEL